DIDGKVRLLSEVVTDKTLITYLERDCEACLLELERLKQAANGQADYEHILLITSANPVHMQKLRAEYGLGCVILYDEERRFGSTLKISSFPFNLVVDRQRVIEAIHANVLLPDDYERFFDEARSVIGMVPHGAAVVNVGSLSLRAEMTPFQTGASQRGNLYVDLAERFEIATSRPRRAVETRDDRFRGFATFPSVVGVCSGLTTT
ncbi:MAG: hypothetical protein NTW07_09525, partial [candidate division Zixibacteria bacterium]|nr:hypothetical protein [candidate division Zixibacteria bacterium]